MRSLLIKLLLFCAIWYEVTVELRLSGGTALVVTLLVCGGLMMMLRIPAQLLSVLGPRAVVLLGPVIVWAGLAWWLAPQIVTTFPAFVLGVGAMLTLVGAALRYAVTRYVMFFARHARMLRGAISPGLSLLLGVSEHVPGGLLTIAAVALLVAMPLRLGWRFVGPVPPPKFDAKMGDAKSFRDSGFRDDR
jgi:hypothetical protein